MTASVAFHVPRLHPESVPDTIRGRAIFVPCGLPAACADSAAVLDSCEAREAVRRSLPWSQTEARVVLDELLRLGDEHSLKGILRQAAVMEQMDAEKRKGRVEELAALDAFATSGRAPVSRAGTNGSMREPTAGENMAGFAEGTLRNILLDSQKLLILAYSLEERVLEMERIEGRFLQAEESFYAALGRDDVEDMRELERESAALFGDAAQTLLVPVPWRMVAEAMLPFLPDKPLFFTADSDMIYDLRAADLLGPFPSDKNDLVADWPPALKAGLSYARLPAWRLLGKRGSLAERPWLDKECEVLAVEEAPYRVQEATA